MDQHITVGADRVITVPDALKEVMMQYDHRITTYTFDLPRYYKSPDCISEIGRTDWRLPDHERDGR